MPRIGRRLISSRAVKRRSMGETHGMQIRLTQECLNEGALDGLERLAAWLGVLPARIDGEPPRIRRRKLMIAITREEGRLATCARSERWMRRIV